MPELEPAPLPAKEPVVVSSLVKLALFGAAWAGIDLPEDNATKIVAGVVALVVFAQATWFARSKVTPVAKADAHLAEALTKLEATHAEAACREKHAYAEGVAVGELAVPTATVVEVSEASDLDRIVAALKKQGIVDIDGPIGIAGPAPAPQPSGSVEPSAKPPAGLYVPDGTVTDTDGPGAPCAPTRQPPPPGLDG